MSTRGCTRAAGQGGPDDYIEAFNDDEVIWLRVIRNLLDAHHIPRQKI
jgi:hypothetical protein